MSADESLFAVPNRGRRAGAAPSVWRRIAGHRRRPPSPAELSHDHKGGEADGCPLGASAFLPLLKDNPGGRDLPLEICFWVAVGLAFRLHPSSANALVLVRRSNRLLRPEGDRRPRNAAAPALGRACPLNRGPPHGRAAETWNSAARIAKPARAASTIPADLLEASSSSWRRLATDATRQQLARADARPAERRASSAPRGEGQRLRARPGTPAVARPSRRGENRPPFSDAKRPAWESPIAAGANSYRAFDESRRVGLRPAGGPGPLSYAPRAERASNQGGASLTGRYEMGGVAPRVPPSRGLHRVDRQGNGPRI